MCFFMHEMGLFMSHRGLAKLQGSCRYAGTVGKEASSVALGSDNRTQPVSLTKNTLGQAYTRHGIRQLSHNTASFMS